MSDQDLHRHTHISRPAIALMSDQVLHRHRRLSRLAIAYLAAVQEFLSIEPESSIRVETGFSLWSGKSHFPQCDRADVRSGSTSS
ncbi:hypothetical protein [Trichocoleus sp. DQ-U1]|uniref:hypothetical protein n=1 Tax=Trichocoleus sp. DQ-U1 TaxID=2933926 RepID=UPI00329A6B8E